ncbi:hypothetical protein L7F22_030022 [Adiantum nelumboides]|nr:hypothetical protein [Adiantum nelumboides]
MASSEKTRLFVGNVPYEATEEEVVKECEIFGPVVSFRLIMDDITGKHKGFGFCTFRDEETVLCAIRNQEGVCCRGKQLKLNHVTVRARSGCRPSINGNPPNEIPSMPAILPTPPLVLPNPVALVPYLQSCPPPSDSQFVIMSNAQCDPSMLLNPPNPNMPCPTRISESSLPNLQYLSSGSECLMSNSPCPLSVSMSNLQCLPSVYTAGPQCQTPNVQFSESAYGISDQPQNTCTLEPLSRVCQAQSYKDPAVFETEATSSYVCLIPMDMQDPSQDPSSAHASEKACDDFGKSDNLLNDTVTDFDNVKCEDAVGLQDCNYQTEHEDNMVDEMLLDDPEPVVLLCDVEDDNDKDDDDMNRLDLGFYSLDDPVGFDLVSYVAEIAAKRYKFRMCTEISAELISKMACLPRRELLVQFSILQETLSITTAPSIDKFYAAFPDIAQLMFILENIAATITETARADFMLSEVSSVMPFESQAEKQDEGDDVLPNVLEIEAELCTEGEEDVRGESSATQANACKPVPCAPECENEEQLIVIQNTPTCSQQQHPASMQVLLPSTQFHSYQHCKQQRELPADIITQEFQPNHCMPHHQSIPLIANLHMPHQESPPLRPVVNGHMPAEFHPSQQYEQHREMQAHIITQGNQPNHCMPYHQSTVWPTNMPHQQSPVACHIITGCMPDHNQIFPSNNGHMPHYQRPPHFISDNMLQHHQSTPFAEDHMPHHQPVSWATNGITTPGFPATTNEHMPGQQLQRCPNHVAKLIQMYGQDPSATPGQQGDAPRQQAEGHSTYYQPPRRQPFVPPAQSAQSLRGAQHHRRNRPYCRRPRVAS